MILLELIEVCVKSINDIRTEIMFIEINEELDNLKSRINNLFPELI